MGEVQVGRELLLGVWGINLTASVQHYAQSYLTHCNELRSLFEEDGVSRANRTEIVELVRLIKSAQNKTIGEIEDEIRKARLRWITPLAGDDTFRRVLDFAIRLWLFVEPDLSDQALTLAEAVEQCLPKRNQPGRNQKKSRKSVTVSKANLSTSGPDGPLRQNDQSLIYLPADFFEKSLTRKGAIKLEWSSYLPDHLSFTGNSRLRVFRHASAIQAFSKPPARYEKPLLLSKVSQSTNPT